MIKEVKAFELHCDRCDEKYVEYHSDYCMWGESELAIESAMNDDWVEHNGGHYCPKCYKFDDDGEIVFGDLSIKFSDLNFKIKPLKCMDDGCMTAQIKINGTKSYIEVQSRSTFESKDGSMSGYSGFRVYVVHDGIRIMDRYPMYCKDKSELMDCIELLKICCLNHEANKNS